MTRTEMLLVKLMEECNEASQRAAKALRFGLTEVQPNLEKNPERENNSVRLAGELMDVLAVVELLEECGATSLNCDRALMDMRRERIEKYLKYSQDVCGTLQ